MRKKGLAKGIILTGIMAAMLMCGGCNKDKTSDTTQSSSAEVTTENTTESTTEAETESTTEAATESTTENTTESTTESATESTTESATESEVSTGNEISSDDALALLETNVGTEDSETGYLLIYGYIDTVTVDGVSYHAFQWSWLVDDHTSSLGILMVSTQGDAIYQAEYDPANDSYTIYYDAGNMLN
jgi:hypothetical protein